MNVALEAVVHLRGSAVQPGIGCGGNVQRDCSQPAGNALCSVVIMLRIFPVLVEIDIGIRVEHRALKLQVQRLRLAIDPLVLVEHGKLVSAGVGSIVAVVGKVQAVVAVGFQVGRAVEQEVLHVMIRHRHLHLRFAQRTVDAEGEGYITNQFHESKMCLK